MSINDYVVLSLLVPCKVIDGLVSLVQLRGLLVEGTGLEHLSLALILGLFLLCWD